jgi:hypothetical protein
VRAGRWPDLVRYEEIYVRADENSVLPAGLSEIRERVHQKSHEYFVFDFNRRGDAKWRMFYGATDALLDAGAAAASYSRAIASDPGVKLVVCYGFLQALYVQQDAVRTLSLAVGLDWHPNMDERLRQIRDTRNRLSGHPAFAGEKQKPPRISSAIIPNHDITENGFRGYVYYEDGIEDLVEVDVSSFLKDNEERLAAHMQVIEMKMDEAERQFRTEQSARPLCTYFENGFSYLLQRLHCDLGDAGRVLQAQSHARMVREIMNKLQQELAERGFESRTTSYHMDRILPGLNLLEGIMSNGSSSSNNQHEFDLIYDGVEKNINELRNVICDIDARLRTPI